MATSKKSGRKPGLARADDDAPKWIQMAKAAPVGTEDMVMLVKPDVKGIVENLESRLRADTIYTYIGHVLCVCNPYKVNLFSMHLVRVVGRRETPRKRFSAFLAAWYLSK